MKTPRELPSGTKLLYGSHTRPSLGFCLLEAVAHVAGEPHSSHPACVCNVLGTIGRGINDRLSDKDRQHLLFLIPLLLNTRVGPAAERKRAFVMIDETLHQIVPAFLDAIDQGPLAAKLREVIHITGIQDLSTLLDHVYQRGLDRFAALQPLVSGLNRVFLAFTTHDSPVLAATSITDLVMTTYRSEVNLNVILQSYQRCIDTTG